MQEKICATLREVLQIAERVEAGTLSPAAAKLALAAGGYEDRVVDMVDDLPYDPSIQMGVDCVARLVAARGPDETVVDVLDRLMEGSDRWLRDRLELFHMLDAMVGRWPEEGSLDDVAQLAQILGVELWARVDPKVDEVRFRPAPEGMDISPESVLGDDTEGWEKVGG